MDRSLWGDAVFAEKNFLDGNIDELGYKTYLKHREMMKRYLMVSHLTIYLNSDPIVCKDRIENIRKRECEKGIPLDYLIGLNNCYKKLLIELEEMGSRVIKVPYNSFMSTEDLINFVGLKEFVNA